MGYTIIVSGSGPVFSDKKEENADAIVTLLLNTLKSKGHTDVKATVLPGGGEGVEIKPNTEFDLDGARDLHEHGKNEKKKEKKAEREEKKAEKKLEREEKKGKGKEKEKKGKREEEEIEEPKEVPEPKEPNLENPTVVEPTPENIDKGLNTL